MQFHHNELFLLYNPQSNAGKQIKALAKDICNHINEIDVIHERLSPTYWKEIIKMLGNEPHDLLDQSHADYKTKVAGNTFTMNGWLDILYHFPHLVKSPIVIYHGKAAFCNTPTDIMRVGGAVAQGSKALPHFRKYSA